MQGRYGGFQGEPQGLGFSLFDRKKQHETAPDQGLENQRVGMAAEG
jgi:hypothetical protein